MKSPSTISSGESDERAKAEAAYTLAAYNYPKDPVGSRDWTLYYGGWLHRAALATQPAESKACASVGVEPVRAYIENFAASIGWKQSDGEGAFEFIQRKSYRQGWEDGRREALGDHHRNLPEVGASPAPSVGEPVAQWQTSASGEGGWMNIDADEVEFCRDKRGYKVRALVLATPPAAPAVTEGAALTEEQRETLLDAAYEWSLYVTADDAPRTLHAHMMAAIDALPVAPAAAVPESPAATEAPSLIKLVSQADAWADWLKTNDAPINAASRETLAGVLSRCVAALASPAPSVGGPARLLRSVWDVTQAEQDAMGDDQWSAWKAELRAANQGAFPVSELLTIVEEMQRDALEVYNLPETSQDVRDAIEYCASWMTVYIEKRAPIATPPAAPATGDFEKLVAETWNEPGMAEARAWAKDTLTQAPAATEAPIATLRFQRSTPGHENDMPEVVSCNWMPDGVYPVYLATPAATEAPSGTHHKAWTNVWLALNDVPCNCSTKRREEGRHLSGCNLFDLSIALQEAEALATPAPGAPGQEAAAVQAVGAWPAELPLRLQVSYSPGDWDTFVYGVSGHLSMEVLTNIEAEIRGEDAEALFKHGPGDYLLSASYYRGQYGPEGQCELPPGWELELEGFRPPAALGAGEKTS